MSTATQDRDFAQRTVVVWTVLLVVMVVAAAVITVGNGNGALTLPLLGVLLVAWFAVGLPAGRRHDTRRAVAYLAVSYAVLVVLTYRDPGSLVLLFALYPQGFVLLERRPAVIATVVLSLAFTITLAARDGFTREALISNTLVAAGNIAFALVIGLFIDGLLRESRERKALVDELRATRDELAAAEREAGANAERERLAQDIHDTLAQGFTSIVMLAQAGETAARDGDAEATGRRLREIQATARDGLAEARALVGAMQPPELADGGLTAALTRLVARFGAETGMDATIVVEGETRPLAAASEVAALRAAQESLANVRKHSDAHSVRVRLCFDEDGATVEVRDDGRGFDPEAPRTGYGIDGLARRLEGVGGMIQVESSADAGTRVRVRVP